MQYAEFEDFLMLFAEIDLEDAIGEKSFELSLTTQITFCAVLCEQIE